MAGTGSRSGGSLKAMVRIYQNCQPMGINNEALAHVFLANINKLVG
jgi:hypothetical protein